MDRRSFLQSTCMGAVGVIVGGTLIDLTNVKTLRASSKRSEHANIHEIPLMLEDTPDLQPIGGAYHLSIEDLDKEILVAHVSATQYAAVDIKCTHKGCDVSYEKESKAFVCPCHGSKFDLGGVPLNGPASKPLMSYKVKVTDTEVTILVPVAGEAPDPADSTSAVKDSTISK